MVRTMTFTRIYFEEEGSKISMSEQPVVHGRTVQKYLINRLKLFWLTVEVSLWVFLVPPGTVRHGT
jgi:hypothetical protein